LGHLSHLVYLTWGAGALPLHGLGGVRRTTRYEHLPIYKKAMELKIYFEKIVRMRHASRPEK